LGLHSIITSIQCTIIWYISVLSIDVWNKFILDNLAIAVPILTILPGTSGKKVLAYLSFVASRDKPLKVPRATMNQDGDEKY